MAATFIAGVQWSKTGVKQGKIYQKRDCTMALAQVSEHLVIEVETFDIVPYVLARTLRSCNSDQELFPHPSEGFFNIIPTLTLVYHLTSCIFDSQFPVVVGKVHTVKFIRYMT